MSVDVQRARRADAAELIAANRDSAEYHAPWVSPFTDQAGFDAWFARGLTGANVSLLALREAVRYAFDELGLHRVEANVQPGNVRSIALVRRAGFVKEGFSPGYLFIDGAWRDHERWALRAGAPSA